MLDLQDVFGAMFDDVGDGVAVRRSQHERLQNEQVESSLEQVTF